MRRAAPPVPISPKLLKHFAAATLVITGLIGLFTSDADWGAKAQVKASQSRNELLETEARKLGTKRLFSSLDQRKNHTAEEFGNDEPAPVEEAQGPSNRQNREMAADTPGPRLPGMAPANLARGTANDAPGVRNPRTYPGYNPEKNGKSGRQRAQPTPEQRQKLLEASRRRSGSPEE